MEKAGAGIGSIRLRVGLFQVCQVSTTQCGIELVAGPRELCKGEGVSAR